jgi:hypothetical protein
VSYPALNNLSAPWCVDTQDELMVRTAMGLSLARVSAVHLEARLIAHMIAAAPELVEVLLESFAFVCHSLGGNPYLRGFQTDQHPTLNHINEALLKATGKPARTLLAERGAQS